MYAMLHTLRKDQPVRIRYDNKTLQTSLLLIGNSVYLRPDSPPRGAPAWTMA
ncbi:PAP2 superfamily domain protein [Mycobacterium ulcerans str. Harvey]|uniref:PAP2 superfamily domain protein n=1 Tax=Mycobacterium ulcerans str. Harvey TaxID=1299332 RepID=A0ABN0QYS7_MYCUL|nr:PAP2 superfamily domain protein [Mycobacterium ulcerans str. Harvey]